MFSSNALHRHIWGSPWGDSNRPEPTHSSRGSLLRQLDNLIAEAVKYSDTSRTTTRGEVNDLKDSARYCLADLGPEARDGLRAIGKLEFPRNLAPDTEESQQRFYELLDQFRTILESVRSKIELGQPNASIAPKEVTHNSNRLKPGDQSSPKNPYSKTDQALYELIGVSNFYSLRNAEIMRWFGPMWRETRPGKSSAAFRSSLCRIRRHNQIPAPAKNVLKD